MAAQLHAVGDALAVAGPLQDGLADERDRFTEVELEAAALALAGQVGHDVHEQFVDLTGGEIHCWYLSGVGTVGGRGDVLSPLRRSRTGHSARRKRGSLGTAAMKAQVVRMKGQVKV